MINQTSDPAVASDPIRILIAEDQQFVADALQALLSQQPGMVVVGTVGSAIGTLSSVATLQPDVVILAFRFSQEFAAVVGMLRQDSVARLILLTRDESENALTAAVELGASGVLNLSTAAHEVIHAVRVVAEGGTLFAPTTIASLLNGRRKTDHMRDRLTTRERQVLTLMSEGKANREIAARMGISYTTVRSHLRNVASKLAAHSKLEILVTAQRNQLLDERAGARVSFA